MKTYYPKKDEVERKWYVVDAEDQVLGRLASEVAAVLRGKRKPEFTPGMDVGDFIIVVNADKIRLTGRKMKNKMYYRHSGYLGNLKEITAEKLLAKSPATVIRKAVWGMLPKGSLGRRMITKLKVYAGSEHRHEAQQPESLVF